MNISIDTQSFIKASIFTALTAVGAFLKIPLPHVPITLQTFVVIMSGNILGPAVGAVSQFLYIIIGLIGIPIFAYGGGLGYIFQPTFGYILAYPFCAFSIGLAIKLLLPKAECVNYSQSKIFFSVFIANTIGVLVIFIIGLGYIYFNIKFGLYKNFDTFNNFSHLNWYSILKTTLFLFVPIDLIKAFLAAVISVRLKRIF